MTGFGRSGKWWHALLLLLVGIAIAYASLHQVGHCAWGGDCPHPALYFAGSIFGVAAVISAILDLLASGLKAAIAALGLTKR
jgi:hypothetical protein